MGKHDIGDLTKRLRYVEIIEQIRDIRESKKDLHLLPALRSESFAIRAACNISPDDPTFEALKLEVPRMKEELERLERERDAAEQGKTEGQEA